MLLIANGCTTSTTKSITQPPSIIISSFNIVTPTCIPGNNGSIQVVASGGVPSLLYKLNNGSWYASNSFNSLTSGIYVVSVLDANGCTISSIMNLTTPNIPVLVNNTLPLTCGTSSAIINVTASNGIAPYTYTLLPNNVSNSTGQFPNVSPGTYTVTVAGANGCTSSLIITIVQPPFLNWQSLIKTQIPCTGGKHWRNKCYCKWWGRTLYVCFKSRKYFKSNRIVFKSWCKSIYNHSYRCKWVYNYFVS